MGGITVTARVPGGRIKIVGGFTLEAGKTTILTLDFGADKSVVIAGSRNVLVKPVIKLLVRDENQSFAAAGQVGQTESEEEPEATPVPTATAAPPRRLRPRPLLGLHQLPWRCPSQRSLRL